ncbi:hypothetical protein OROGR_007811 [Orobanche gracilis]
MEKSDTTANNSGVLVSEPTPGSVETLNRRSFRPISTSHQEKLREALPMIKLLLEELGHSCSMDTVDSIVLVESPSSTDPEITRRTNYLFELLCKTSVPAYLAIELAFHGRQHYVINFGTQTGGVCQNYGINKEEFEELWTGLKSCLKELEDLTHCTLYLNKGTLAVVGPSPRLCWVKNIWKFSIIGKSSPDHVIRVLNSKLKKTTIMMRKSDALTVEKSDFCILEQPVPDHLVSDPFLIRGKNDFGVHDKPKSNQEVNNPIQAESSKCFSTIYAENQAKLKEAWPMVESSLEELGYICTMSIVNSTVLVVSPCSTDPDMLHKAKFLFKLLHKTHVPAHLAMDLALHGRQHDLITLGTLKDGMCVEYRITREKFYQHWRSLKRSLKELEDLTHCTLFLVKKTLLAVGPSPRLHWVSNVWRFSVTRKLSPEDVIRIFNKQLNRSTMIMGNNDNMTEESDCGLLEQPKFHSKVNPFQMEGSDTIMVEKSDLCVLQEPKSDRVVNGPLPSMSSNFSVVEQPKFNHEVSDTLLKKSTCFHLSENRAKLREALPMVRSSLEQLGYSLSMDGSKFTSVLPCLKDPEIRRKFVHLVKLLFKTPVPAPLSFSFCFSLMFYFIINTSSSIQMYDAIELALHGRQHDYIKLGPVGGLRQKYGMDMEKLDKLRRGLRRSLKDLEDLTQCALFLNMNTLTAVGPSPRLDWVRRVLIVCIKGNTSPFHAISAFRCKYDQRIANVRDIDLSNVKSTGHLVREDGLAEVTLSFPEAKAKRMEDALSMVESSLEKYGICCRLNLTNHTMSISTTEAIKEYPDAFKKARHLLQLLTTTNVPPSLAIDLALNGKQHEFIEIGFQEGGLCSLYGITEEQYSRRWKWFACNFKDIKKWIGCGPIYFSASGGTVCCVGRSSAPHTTSARLSTFRKVVLACIVEDLNPEYLIRKNSKQKLMKRIDRFLAQEKRLRLA